MSITLTVDEAQEQFTELLNRLQQENTDFEITRNGVPVARIIAIPSPPKPRRIPGRAAGKIVIAPDFDPLPDDLLDAFEGK